MFLPDYFSHSFLPPRPFFPGMKRGLRVIARARDLSGKVFLLAAAESCPAFAPSHIFIYLLELSLDEQFLASLDETDPRLISIASIVDRKKENRRLLVFSKIFSPLKPRNFKHYRAQQLRTVSRLSNRTQFCCNCTKITKKGGTFKIKISRSRKNRDDFTGS